LRLTFWRCLSRQFRGLHSRKRVHFAFTCCTYRDWALSGGVSCWYGYQIWRAEQDARRSIWEIRADTIRLICLGAAVGPHHRPSIRLDPRRFEVQSFPVGLLACQRAKRTAANLHKWVGCEVSYHWSASAVRNGMPIAIAWPGSACLLAVGAQEPILQLASACAQNMPLQSRLQFNPEGVPLIMRCSALRRRAFGM
jgi:hypothetical protein